MSARPPLARWLARRGEALLDLAGRLGADAADGNETGLQKRLAVALCVGTLPFTAAWSAPSSPGSSC